jgi:3'-phosphoadenosine 5'-phosphosulfate sulfotransferase (PAPS reductase)/FAD synthetase
MGDGGECMSDKVDIAVRRLQEAAEMSQVLYEKPLVITYSGGKDSDTVLKLAQIAKIPFEVLHSHTTVDAPETVYHVRETFRKLELTGIKCDIDYHVRPDGTRTTMWNLIPKKMMPPTRIVRYCCAELKEGGGKDRFIVTGVRWDESNARKKSRGILEVIASKRENKIVLSNDNDEDRRLFETCQMKGKRVVNPIVDWTTRDGGISGMVIFMRPPQIPAGRFALEVCRPPSTSGTHQRLYRPFW